MNNRDIMIEKIKAELLDIYERNDKSAEALIDIFAYALYNNMTDAPERSEKDKNGNPVWYKYRQFEEVLNLIRTKKWSWVKNYDCKYIELRIDTRDGGLLIYDRNRRLISIDELKLQHSGPDKRYFDELKTDNSSLNEYREAV